MKNAVAKYVGLSICLDELATSKCVHQPAMCHLIAARQVERQVKALPVKSAPTLPPTSPIKGQTSVYRTAMK